MDDLIDWSKLTVKERMNLWLTHPHYNYDFWCRVIHRTKPVKLQKQYGQLSLFDF